VLGSGGHDISNGICTIHAASSSAGIERDIVNLSLDVEFPYGTGYQHIYSLVYNNQGYPNPENWLYWGWWRAQ